MAVTITDIARMAGVSIATVSRVLNGTGRVAEGTRARVLEVVARYEYVPNTTGRSLRRAKSFRILVLARHSASPFYMETMAGIQQTAEAAGYTVLVQFAGQNQGATTAARLYGENAVDGVIVHLERAGIATALAGFAPDAPVVQCSEYDESLPYPYVGIDDTGAAGQVTRHLLGLGHRDIALLNYGASAGYSGRRLQGFRREMDAAGLPVGPGRVKELDGSYDSAYFVAKALLEDTARPTAIFAVTDTYALATLNAAKSLGLRVPEDVSIAGFDNLDISWMAEPAITTVNQPKSKIGGVAATLLLQALAGNPPREARHILETELLVRGSTGPAPQ